MTTAIRAWLGSFVHSNGTLERVVTGARRLRLMQGVRTRIRGSGNELAYRGVIMSGVRIEIEGSRNRISIAPGCVLNNVRFVVRGDDHVVEIAEGVRYSGTILAEDGGTHLTIGPRSSFVGTDISLTEPGSRIRIGADCLFAYSIDVRNGDSHSIISADTGQRVNLARDVTIGDRVWVGFNSTILKGVAIADDSVVGAASVLTRVFPEPGVVIAGSPAVVVRTGIRWSAERSPAAAVS